MMVNFRLVRQGKQGNNKKQVAGVYLKGQRGGKRRCTGHVFSRRVYYAFSQLSIPVTYTVGWSDGL